MKRATVRSAIMLFLSVSMLTMSSALPNQTAKAEWVTTTMAYGACAGTAMLVLGMNHKQALGWCRYIF